LNIEQGISNDEVRNRFAPPQNRRTILPLYIIKMIEYLTSTFIIPCSIFCGSKAFNKAVLKETKVLHRI